MLREAQHPCITNFVTTNKRIKGSFKTWYLLSKIKMKALQGNHGVEGQPKVLQPCISDLITTIESQTRNLIEIF